MTEQVRAFVITRKIRQFSCEVCGKQFETVGAPHARFCSGSCSQKWHYRFGKRKSYVGKKSQRKIDADNATTVASWYVPVAAANSD
jgi:hypothetical protein